MGSWRKSRIFLSGPPGNTHDILQPDLRNKGVLRKTRGCPTGSVLSDKGRISHTNIPQLPD
jgi:hypothetical protein